MNNNNYPLKVLNRSTIREAMAQLETVKHELKLVSAKPKKTSEDIEKTKSLVVDLNRAYMVYETKIINKKAG